MAKRWSQISLSKMGLLVLGSLTIGVSAATGAERMGDSAPSVVAAEILARAGVSGGLIVHVGCGSGQLTAALRASDSYLVHGLDTEAENVRKAREHLQSLGVYGPVSIDRFDGATLPYVENLVNLVVSEDLGRVPVAEVTRVLAPGGVACVKKNGGWAQTVKPWPEEIDEWTHWLHGPDGNAVADDRVVGPPRHAQWTAGPRWQRHHELSPSTSAMVSCGGRLFAIVDEAPAGVDNLTDQWSLVARDAFNGTLLWKRPIAEWGSRQWSDHSYGNGRWNHPTHVARRLVAAGDRVYVTLGFNAPLVALDAATGRTKLTYPEGRFTDEVLYDQGTLVLAVNQAAQRPGRAESHPPEKKSVVALDAATGKLLWKTGDFTGVASKADAIERVTHLSMVLGGGKVFLVEEDAVVALDLATGERLWRKRRPPREKAVTYGSYYFGNLCTLVYHNGTVLFTEPDPATTRTPWNGPAKSVLMGISAETGDVLWSRPCGMWGHYNPGDVFVIDGLAWVHDAEAFSMMGLDPRTGEVKATLSTKEALDQGHHHRCYRNKATTRYILTGRRGVELIDIDSNRSFRHHWVRGTCRYGVLPSNGLLYAPPHPCVCYITAKLTGLWALAAERKSRARRDEEPSGLAVELGPAHGGASGLVSTDPPHPEDWPTYRHDAARSGSAGTSVSGTLHRVWETHVGARPSGPVIAEGTVFVATPDAHTVSAFDASDGRPRWSYTAGGRVDTPPTVYRGLALFGSADGWVYCLRAADGQLVWRRRVAPADLRMVSWDQVESVWPVHGSVLIQDGVAYVAAGRSSFLDGGIHVLALDPLTGRVLRHNCVSSLDPKTGDMVECRLPYDMPRDAPGALPDVLVGDGQNVYMRHLRFDPALPSVGHENAPPNGWDYETAAAAPGAEKRKRTHPAVGAHLMSVAGLLDDAWFNQTYWTVDGQSHSKLLVFEAGAAYGVKPFPGSARHSRAIFKPGTNGYTLFANERPGHQTRWSIEVPVRFTAMVVAGSTLFAAGTPDVADPDDPWAAIEGRRGGLLWTVSTEDGRKLGEYHLDNPPIFDGMAAARGRLYVSTIDGKVACFGAE